MITTGTPPCPVMFNRFRNLNYNVVHKISVGAGAFIGGNLAAYDALESNPSYKFNAVMCGMCGSAVGATVMFFLPMAVPLGIVATIACIPAYTYHRLKSNIA